MTRETQVWIIEDNPKIGAHVGLFLTDHGHQVEVMPTAEAAGEQLRLGGPPDVMLVDIRLPGQSGLDWIERLDRDLLPRVIVISGEATVSEALTAMKAGVHDFIEKPFSDERLLYAVRNCLEKQQLRLKVADLEQRLNTSKPMIGEDPATQTTMRRIEKVAPTNGRILITGESGTGKEVVAATIHRLSPRKNKPFVKINCAAIPTNLIEGELFGHVRGAFTGAVGTKIGLFEQADGGTLFLDEIGDMEFPLQARLLRVLEDGKVRRLGDREERKVDVRVLAATNKDLKAESAQGNFREDLYYRLSSLPIHVPPLRERRGDIKLLLSYYVNQFCVQHQTGMKQLDAALLDVLNAYHWPGNIRELRNLAEQLVVFGGNPITTADLPSHIFEKENHAPHGLLRISEIPTMPWKKFKAQCEKEYLETVLHRANWNMKKVAQQLSINRTYLHTKVAALGIHRKKS
ncbi:sigma-54-dependent transcriptional regulator [Acanthopleuribacter pedis]|uniref:Sigma-54-dependent Fis family transcriptional regulator n=1 Tax=Acanthopleuribacter pedis TaxID=442870 RepID=A0A8J7Q3P0_9BACT|nr:sigma-54 dependent transcriptional regulator [Acanthopleuribacter pedis]MBO1317487.1 sigma-54-dependent Fis family transcriptional regulator [Acanthopleuribacter pedis]